MSDQALILIPSDRLAAASSRLLGLEVAERSVLNLRQQGVEQITVAGPEDAIPEPRRQGLRFVVAESELGAVRQLLQEQGGGDEGLIVVPGDVVYHPKLIPSLRQQAQRDSSAVVCGETADSAVIYLAAGSAAAAARDAGVSDGSLSSLVQELERGGLAVRLQAPEGFFATRVVDHAARRRAIDAFLRTNWRPHDGIVARLINKHISVAISRRIVALPITPNQMTAFAFVLALVGIGLAARGTYLTFLLGAALVQLQSVLDGCDGELARMRYQSSRWGAWFDTIVDDVIGILWVLALGSGCYHAHGHWAYLAAGAGAALLYFVSTGLVFLALWRDGAVSHAEFTWWFEEGSNPEETYPDLTRFSTWLKYAVRRDFYVLLFLLLAVPGWLRVALAIAVLGAVGWFITTMIQLGKRGLRVVHSH